MIGPMKNRGFLIGQFAIIPKFSRMVGQIVASENSTEDGSRMPILEFNHGARLAVHLNNCIIMNEDEEKVYRMLND